MKRLRLRKIKHRLYLSYGVMVLVLCMVTGVSYAISRQAIEKSVTESYQHSLSLIAQTIEERNSDVIRFYDLVYNSGDVMTYVNRVRTGAGLYDRHYNYVRLNSLMGDFVSGIFFDSRLYEAVLYSTDGAVLYYSWNLSPPDEESVAKDLPPGMTDGNRFYLQRSPGLNPRDRAREFLHYYRLLPNHYNAPHELYVIAGIPVESFEELLTAAGPRGSSFSFLDAQGNVVLGYADSDFPTDGRRTIRLSAPLPSVGLTLTQDIPTGLILSDLNRWSAFAIFAVAVLVGCVILFCGYIARRISRPIDLLYGDMRQVQAGRWDYPRRDYYDDEIGDLSRQFSVMVDEIRRLNAEMLEKERQKRTLEMEALQAQINPHFMYNTINSIKMLVRFRRQEQILSTLTALTDILKGTLGKSEAAVPLEEELRFLESYVYIQQIRYSSFGFATDIPRELEGARILRFILQPFVENSIFHGYDQIDGGARIELRAQADREVGTLVITITDNGKGMDADMLAALARGEAPRSRFSGIGIRNVMERVRLAFGEPFGVYFESEVGEGTTARIILPLMEEEHGNG